MFETDFYCGKSIFVTGHTGFKGSWLSALLVDAGARVTGFSLPAPTTPNLFEISGIESSLVSITGDVRDRQALTEAMAAAQPEIVFHLAAQPIVRDGYKDPVYTYETNVMGTVNLLEAIRKTKSIKSVLNVTTDKVYLNREWEWGYRENEQLDGFDPYSNSKSCSELVTHCYRNSFFTDGGPAISTARAGNVIGGGDFSNDRIVPDCMRAIEAGMPIIVRNPLSIRPYQHVLEPLFAYLMIAERQYLEPEKAGYYNIGPDDCDCVTTGSLADLFCSYWGGKLEWQNVSEPNAPHEATFLKLDCSKIKSVFDWRPRWGIERAIEETCKWIRVYLARGNIREEMSREIAEYVRRV